MHDAIRQEFTTSMPWMLSTVHGVEYSAAYFNAPKACAEIARLREIEAAARAVVEAWQVKCKPDDFPAHMDRVFDRIDALAALLAGAEKKNE